MSGGIVAAGPPAFAFISIPTGGLPNPLLCCVEQKYLKNVAVLGPETLALRLQRALDAMDTAAGEVDLAEGLAGSDRVAMRASAAAGSALDGSGLHAPLLSRRAGADDHD